MRAGNGEWGFGNRNCKSARFLTIPDSRFSIPVSKGDL